MMRLLKSLGSADTIHIETKPWDASHPTTPTLGSQSLFRYYPLAIRSFKTQPFRKFRDYSLYPSTPSYCRYDCPALTCLGIIKKRR